VSGPLAGTAEAAEGTSGSRPWASPLSVPDKRLSGSDNAILSMPRSGAQIREAAASAGGEIKIKIRRKIRSMIRRKRPDRLLGLS
jgi:hypothetical protein